MESKSWYKSKGMVGGLGAILGGVGLIVQGFDPEAIIQSLIASLEGWYVLATGVLATAGRYAAQTKITK